VRDNLMDTILPRLPTLSSPPIGRRPRNLSLARLKVSVSRVPLRAVPCEEGTPHFCLPFESSLWSDLSLYAFNELPFFLRGGKHGPIVAFTHEKFAGFH